jgi:hypothetical protein
MQLPGRSFFLRGQGSPEERRGCENVVPSSLWFDSAAHEHLSRAEPGARPQRDQQEALARRLEAFARFLQVPALMNGQVSNLAGIARDAAVARPTVQGYFQTLVDTLVGF